MISAFELGFIGQSFFESRVKQPGTLKRARELNRSVRPYRQSNAVSAVRVARMRVEEVLLALFLVSGPGERARDLLILPEFSE